MSIEKAEVKVGTAHEIGCRLDDALEASTKDLYRLEGASMALRQASQLFEPLGRQIDKDMDGGKFDLETATLIKQYVEKGRQSVLMVGQQSEHNRVVQLGKVQAMEAAVKIAQKFKEDEENKARLLRSALQEALSSPEGTDDELPRPVGMRPGPTLKERRLAAQAAKEASASPPASKPDTTPPPRSSRGKRA